LLKKTGVFWDFWGEQTLKYASIQMGALVRTEKTGNKAYILVARTTGELLNTINQSHGPAPKALDTFTS
jgi:hypothetical protein